MIPIIYAILMSLWAITGVTAIMAFDSKDPGETFHTTEPIELYLYVFNDKTQLWDRAREETLRNAACESIRSLQLKEGVWQERSKQPLLL